MGSKVQKAFREFDDNIRLPRMDKDGDDKSSLQKLREEAETAIRDGLKTYFEDADESPPTFDARLQGSYAMSTGIKPLPGSDRDYDIDVALLFNIVEGDEHWNEDPTILKMLVCDVLNDCEKEGWELTQLRPCVRVDVTDENTHLDLALYARATNTERLLAVGLPHGDNENKSWEESDPIGLIDELARRTSSSKPLGNDDRHQYQRVIRALKRWKDLKFPERGNSAPPGVGLTAAAYHWFTGCSRRLSGERDDLEALIRLVGRVLQEFESRWDSASGDYKHRLKLPIPVTPENDIFGKMSDLQSEKFFRKLELLKSRLEAARDAASDHAASRILSGEDVFGSDFPEIAEERARQVRPVINASESG